jgi:hypothetical protein
MVLISLKTYWEKELKKNKSKEQVQINRILDQILDSKNEFCAKGGFQKQDLLLNIEFGDYLFYSLDKGKVNAFAITVDQPGSYDIWDPTLYAKPHGVFYISVICSQVKGKGFSILEEMKHYARDILLRTSLRLTYIDVPKLILTYKSWGFMITNRSKHEMTLELIS